MLCHLSLGNCAHSHLPFSVTRHPFFHTQIRLCRTSPLNFRGREIVLIQEIIQQGLGLVAGVFGYLRFVGHSK